MQQALVAALAADAAFAALAGPVFDGLAPRTYPVRNPPRIGYVTLPNSQETDERTFGRKGYTDTETLNIHAGVREDVKRIYAELERVLNGPKLALPGGTHVMLRSEARLVGCTLDQDGVSALGVVTYVCITQVDDGTATAAVRDALVGAYLASAVAASAGCVEVAA